MLASITPLGERGRHRHWGSTVAFFVAGSAGAGALAGAALGLAGKLVLPASLGAAGRLAVLALALLAAVALDSAPARVPGPRRQVDERWLDRYRGWVYGLGYGAQLGLGVTTVITSAATYAALVAALLAGSALGGAAILGCYGAIRGLTLLGAARVRTPRQLLELHARLARGRQRSARCGALLMAVVCALAVAGSIG